MKLIQFLCTIGCSLQLIQVIYYYLQWDTLNEVMVTFPKKFKVPDITLCTDYLYAVNFDNLLRFYQEKIPSECSNSSSDGDSLRQCFVHKFGPFLFHRFFVAPNFKIVQLYRDLLYKPEEIFDRLSHWNRPGNSLKNGRCNVTTYMREPHVCYTTSCQWNGKPIIMTLWDVNRAPNVGALFSLNMKETIYKYWVHTHVYLHEPGTLPRGFEASVTTINRISKPAMYVLHYRRVAWSLLPEPYGTGCKNYHDHNGPTDRLAVLEECLNRNSLRQYNTTYYSTFTSPELNAGFAGNFRDKFPDRYPAIEVECAKLITKPQCKAEWYVAYLNGVQETPRLNTSFFSIMAPTEPDLLKRTVPAFPFSQLMIYLGSVLGTWFGFNFVQHGDYPFVKLSQYLSKWGQMKPTKRIPSPSPRPSIVDFGGRSKKNEFWAKLQGFGKRTHLKSHLRNTPVRPLGPDKIKPFG